MVMKFLVTGSSGLIGSQLIKDLTEKDFNVYSCYNTLQPEFGHPILLDLNDLSNIATTVRKIEPDVIIHLAALTNVDLCEKEKNLATKINVDATKILLQCISSQTFFLYVSTDYVFDGQKGMYNELSPTNPINFYGKTKREGESAVLNSAKNSCIVRTSTPFGLHNQKKSFPIWVVENLRQNHQIKVPMDQYTSPTYVPNLCKMLVEITTKQITGILHLAGETRISRYEFAKLITNKMHLDYDLIKPVSLTDMHWVAQRPKDSSLDISKAKPILQEKPLDIHQSLSRLYGLKHETEKIV